MKSKGKKIKNVNLKNMSSMHIGGKAKRIFIPKNIGQLNNIIIYSKKIKKKLIILGNCTNIIFKDKTYRDVFVSMKGFDRLSCDGEIITCGAGVNLYTLCAFCEKHGLSGLEFAYGIPGTLGGAIAMNAGAFGGEICPLIENITTLKDGNVISRSELVYGYRNGPLGDDEVLIEAKIRLKRCRNEEIVEKQSLFLQNRKISQPNEPSCGSVFKRKNNIIPAKLIDEWGLKGLKIGGAAISEKHAGFIVNKGGAKYEDVISLIEIIEWVAKSRGYFFERELKII